MRKTTVTYTAKNGILLDEIFSKEQGGLIKRAIVSSQELSENLFLSILRLGNETNVLLYGKDQNKNVHYSMLSESTFKKLKKINLKGT